VALQSLSVSSLFDCLSVSHKRALPLESNALNRLYEHQVAKTHVWDCFSRLCFDGSCCSCAGTGCLYGVLAPSDRKLGAEFDAQCYCYSGVRSVLSMET